ncbi:MAG: DNA repair protein RecO [Patescibacteria group bacterium]
MNQKAEGIILSRRNLGEADRILTIYTKEFGKISCIAKGVRKPTSRKSGHVELGSWCKIYVAHGKSLDILTEVELKKSFGHDDSTQEKTNRIYHMLELVNCLTAQNQKNSQVFFLLIEYLKKLAQGESFNLISTVFKLKLLSALGFFSSVNLKHTQSKLLLEKFESDKFEDLKNININEENYLKLLAFLDSIIENVTERKLYTNKFIIAH